jgi:cellulose 1,4-beta-cellobiosidase
LTGRRLAALLGASALAAGGLVAVGAAPAHAQTACTVDYETTWDGGGGFGANVTIDNLGPAINGWTLTFAFPGNQQITNGWIAVWSQSGQNVTATNESWSASIPSGGSLTLGFNGSYSGSNQAPATFTLNGAACDGTGGGGDDDPAVQASPGTLSIQGGSSANVTFTLSEAPSGNVPVSLSLSGSSAITVSPTSLTLTAANWSSGASATVNTTAGPTNATATLTASASGYDPATVSITRLGEGTNQDRVDNPYAGADVYVNPDWSAAAETGGAPSSIYNQPTGVWLDRRAAITSGSAGENTMGLADHLDGAVAQDAANGSTPTVIQIVIYNLPGRDCAALASNGELGPEELDVYQTEYIDVITDIMSDPAYADLRIVNVIEIDSLPNLVTNVTPRATFTPECDVMAANQNYQNGIAYAVAQLGSLPNTYNYIDAGHHGWIGWTNTNPEFDNFHASAVMIGSILGREGATAADVHGFITNTANFSVLDEPFFDIGDVVGGQPIREVPGTEGGWIDWNDYLGELAFAQAFRTRLTQEGFDPGIGMLIDTSRNGWGGPDRPTGTSTSNDPVTYMDESRTDRRLNLGNWCNQSGAGLGERPQASPESGIDAYVWIKPPGESDGSSEFIENDEGKGFDQMCDPTFTEGTPRNGNNPSGALPNAPLSGHWFQAQFEELLANAFPPVS